VKGQGETKEREMSEVAPWHAEEDKLLTLVGAPHEIKIGCVGLQVAGSPQSPVFGGKTDLQVPVFVGGGGVSLAYSTEVDLDKRKNAHCTPISSTVSRRAER
jgi:hypothetical protein